MHPVRVARAQEQRRVAGDRRGAATAACVALVVACALPSRLEAQRGQSAQPDLRSVDRELSLVETALGRLTAEPLQANPPRSPRYVEERLTDGELFYRLHDYLRASIILSDIVDNFPNHRSVPDALYLLGDSLFQAGDYLGARSRFRVIIDRAGQPGYRAFVQRALGRLVEIAIRTRNFDGVEDYFQRLSQLPTTEAEASTTYFRAKYLYSRAVPDEEFGSPPPSQGEGSPEAPATATPAPSVDLTLVEQARQLFDSVPPNTPFSPQARYFVGVVHVLRREFPQAIEAFRAVLQGPAESPEHRLVSDLSWLALGRLYYETDQLPEAVEAYQSVPRTSTLFARALFEIAWVYIRMGEAIRAERALEVLSVAAPDSPLIPEGQILRGNLLLRNGRYDDALRVFRQVREDFGPVRRELDAIAESHTDLHAYFRQLVRENMEDFDVDHFLPPSARRWTDLEGEGFDRAVGALADLAFTRQLLEETESLIERLTAALGAPRTVHLFSDMRTQHQGIEALRNRLFAVRRTLLGMEAGSATGASPELQQVRERRRAIEEALASLPTSASAFTERDHERIQRVRDLSRELGRVSVELMGLRARVSAITHFLDQTAAQGNDTSAIRSELQLHEASITTYEQQIEQLRRMLEVARLGVAGGDDDPEEREDRLRAEYAALLTQERELAGTTGSPEEPYFQRVAAVEARLDAREAEVQQVVETRVRNMQRIVEEESANVIVYRRTLAELSGESEDVVGGITQATFENVRHRFYDLVLRADVGRIDVAWQRRESHRQMIEQLTRRRADEVQELDDEFREITEGAGEGDATP